MPEPVEAVQAGEHRRRTATLSTTSAWLPLHEAVAVLSWQACRTELNTVVGGPNRPLRRLRCFLVPVLWMYTSAVVIGVLIDSRVGRAYGQGQSVLSLAVAPNSWPWISRSGNDQGSDSGGGGWPVSAGSGVAARAAAQFSRRALR
jgi:hypothetical protein